MSVGSSALLVWLHSIVSLSIPNVRLFSFAVWHGYFRHNHSMCFCVSELLVIVMVGYNPYRQSTLLIGMRNMCMTSANILWKQKNVVSSPVLNIWKWKIKVTDMTGIISLGGIIVVLLVWKLISMLLWVLFVDSVCRNSLAKVKFSIAQKTLGYPFHFWFL